MPDHGVLTVVHGPNLRRCKPELGSHVSKKVTKYHTENRREFDLLVVGHLGPHFGPNPADQLLVFELIQEANPVFVEVEGDVADEDNPTWKMQDMYTEHGTPVSGFVHDYFKNMETQEDTRLHFIHQKADKAGKLTPMYVFMVDVSTATAAAVAATQVAAAPATAPQPPRRRPSAVPSASHGSQATGGTPLDRIKRTMRKNLTAELSQHWPREPDGKDGIHFVRKSDPLIKQDKPAPLVEDDPYSKPMSKEEMLRRFSNFSKSQALKATLKAHHLDNIQQLQEEIGKAGVAELTKYAEEQISKILQEIERLSPLPKAEQEGLTKEEIKIKTAEIPKNKEKLRQLRQDYEKWRVLHPAKWFNSEVDDVEWPPEFEDAFGNFGDGTSVFYPDTFARWMGGTLKAVPGRSSDKKRSNSSSSKDESGGRSRSSSSSSSGSSSGSEAATSSKDSKAAVSSPEKPCAAKPKQRATVASEEDQKHAKKRLRSDKLSVEQLSLDKSEENAKAGNKKKKATKKDAKEREKGKKEEKPKQKKRKR